MQDKQFGSLSGKQLHLRWFTPCVFERWTGHGFALSPWRLLNPRRWFRAVFNRGHYNFWWRFDRETNSRCWCPVGSLFRGRIEVAGFGLLWWYSVFTGDVPCPCDVAFGELEEEQEEEVARG